MPARYGSDLIVDLLKVLGVECVALNPGSSFRGIHDSLVNYSGGKPEMVLTDRGAIFHTWSGIGRFDRVLEAYDIQHILASPENPRTCGKIEAVNKNIQKELIDRVEFRTYLDAKEQIGRWIDGYNHQRTHQGIGGVLVPADRFFGRYAKLDANAGEAPGLPSLGSFMNDRTSSVLIYRKSANEVSAALGELVSPGQVTAVISSQEKLSPRGDPIFTWDMFPDGQDGHPNETWKMYIYIRIPVTVAVPHWFDYDAEIRYWIYPFVDQSGRLHASLEYYGAWVEGGLITDDVLDGLMAPDGIPSSLGQVTGLISPATDAVNVISGPFSSAYLLPGRNEVRGNTDDDVTVVLVQGMPSPPGPIL